MKKNPTLIKVTFAFTNVYCIQENFHLHFIFISFAPIIEAILNLANFSFSIYLKKNSTYQILEGRNSLKVLRGENKMGQKYSYIQYSNVTFIYFYYFHQKFKSFTVENYNVKKQNYQE